MKSRNSIDIDMVNEEIIRYLPVGNEVWWN